MVFNIFRFTRYSDENDGRNIEHSVENKNKKEDIYVRNCCSAHVSVATITTQFINTYNESYQHGL